MSCATVHAQAAALGGMAVQGAAFSRQPSHAAHAGSGANGSDDESDDPDAFFERRLIKPLPVSRSHVLWIDNLAVAGVHI